MSQSFSVRAAHELPFGQILSLADLTSLDIDVRQQPEVLEQYLGDEPVYVAGPLAGRGFGVSFEGGEYVVRVNTPAASCDWQAALTLLRRLAETLSADVVDESDQRWPAAKIVDFPYRDDITGGIRAMSGTENGGEGMVVHGALRPVTFSAQDWAGIVSAPDPVAAFDAFLAAAQETGAAQ